jgi:flagellin-like protein
MRKLLKSRKALSPVVAAIILIAVTVAVSIAVAAWMGSLTIGFMETNEITVNGVTFAGTDGAADNTIVVALTNTGTSTVTISSVKLNGETATSSDTPLTIEPGDPDTLTITAAGWDSGNKYSISLFTTDGTLVGSHTETA